MALQPSVNVRPGLCLPIFEIALSIQGRHATGAGAGNGLAVDVILDVASRKDANCVEIPAVPAAQIIDQTGAGNTYCGALLAGLVQGRTLREAAVMGAVAASFCLECRGVLQPDRISKVERNRRYKQINP